MKTATRKQKRKREARAATTYQTPAQWLMDILVGDVGTAGVSVNERTALNAGTVFACVRNLSEDIAKLPLMVYRRLPRGREKADNSPLWTLLHDAPNNEMTSMDFRQACNIDLMLGGNAYAEIVSNIGGMPLSMHKLDRHLVKPKRNDAGQIVYEVTDPQNGPVILPQEKVLHLRGLGDGLMGWSIIRLAKASIGLAMAQEKNSESFFGNSSVPSGVLKVKKKLDPKSIDNLRKSWEALHGGPENKHKIAILEEDMEFNPMSINPDDAQFLESREFSVEEICRWFRMPPHKVGHLKRATGWSTLEVTNTDYVIDTLMPWTERWEQEIQRKLIPKSEKSLYVEHLFDGMLRGDSAARSTLYREQFNIGALSQNDIREMENRNPIGPEGDTYYVPLNMVPSEIAVEGPQKPSEPAGQADPEPIPAPDQGANRARRLELIERGFVDTLSMSLRSVLRVEQARVNQFRDKPDFKVWASKFFADTPMHLRAAIGSVMEAFTASACAAMTDAAPTEPLLKALGEEMNKIAERHTSVSLSEMAEPAKVENWMARADVEAKAELSAVSKMILEFANGENHG